MSTHVQLRDDPPKISCWEVCRYACSSEWMWYLKVIGWILLVLLCLAVGYGLGLLCMWGIDRNPPNEMDTGEFIGAIFMGIVASAALILVVALIGSIIYYSIIGCRECYAKKEGRTCEEKIRKYSWVCSIIHILAEMQGFEIRGHYYLELLPIHF